MNKTLKIILIIAAALVVVFIIGYLFLRPNPKTGQKNTIQNLFPFGQPKEIQQNESGSGLASPTQTQPTGEQGGTETTGTTGSTGTTITAPGTSSTPTVIETGTPSQAPTTPTQPAVTQAPTPATTDSVPQAPTPATPSGPGSLTATAAPLLQERPTGVNCDSSAGNTCFNQIEAAIYFTKAELAQVEKTLLILRGTTGNDSLSIKLMKLDHCIPGPDFGYANRALSLLTESSREWQDILGDDVNDQRKKNGTMAELSEVIANMEAEINIRSKNIPMAQSGLAFVSATPKYNDLAREYRSKKTELNRTLSALQDLNAQWKLAKQNNNEALKQEVTARFAQINTTAATYDSFIESINNYQKIASDAQKIDQLTVTCQNERVTYKNSFTQQTTYIGSKIKQNIWDITVADNAKKLFCSADPYHINNLDQSLDCRILEDIASHNDEIFCAGDQPDDNFNTDTDWYDTSVFEPITAVNINTGVSQVVGAVFTSPGPMTLPELLSKHNPELSPISFIADDDLNLNVFGPGGLQDLHPNGYAVIIDDQPDLYAHNMRGFGVSCGDFYTSSRYDYIDELTLYGF